MYNKGDIMNYKVLSEQYFAQYKNLSVYIKELKKQLSVFEEKIDKLGQDDE